MAFPDIIEVNDLYPALAIGIPNDSRCPNLAAIADEWLKYSMQTVNADALNVMMRGWMSAVPDAARRGPYD